LWSSAVADKYLMDQRDEQSGFVAGAPLSAVVLSGFQYQFRHRYPRSAGAQDVPVQVYVCIYSGECDFVAYVAFLRIQLKA